MIRTLHYRAGGNPPTLPTLRYDNPLKGELVAHLPWGLKPTLEVISLIEIAYEDLQRPLQRSEVTQLLRGSE